MIFWNYFNCAFCFCFCIYFINCGVSGLSVLKVKQAILKNDEKITTTTTTSTTNPSDIFAYTVAGGDYEEDKTNIVWETFVNNIKDTTQKPAINLLMECDKCPENVNCVPQIQCPAHVRLKDHEKPQVCDLPGDSYGFCCFTGQNHTAMRPNIARTPFTEDLPMALVERTFRKFEEQMHNLAVLPVRFGQPEFNHGIAFHSNKRDNRLHYHLSNSALQQMIAGQLLAKKENIPLDNLITNDIQVNFKKTPLAHHCAPSLKCPEPNARYRSFDGNCNNKLMHRSRWGSAGQPMERILPPAYEDGIWTPRLHGIDGSELLSAREISRRLMNDLDMPHPKYNLLLMQFGQFLAHDVSQSAAVRLENGDQIECCTAKGAHPLPEHKRHLACMPIMVAHDDDFFSTFNVRCLNFVRLSLVPNTECKMGYGKQLNKVTHFIDASGVYGSSEEASRDLREFIGGRLKMRNEFGRDLLPMESDGKSCASTDPSKTCYKAGDGRTNVIISLTTLHLLFSREHNRIAAQLATLNPRLSDETLFQESRRILVAELQHIVYSEYLPAVIGPIQMQRFRLKPQKNDYANGYKSDVNPAVTNEFTGAAFRMGHSTVYGKFNMYREGDSQLEEIINIPDVMLNPSRMRGRSFYDNMLRSMYTQPMQRVDRFITHGLSRYLFRGDSPFGLDLAAFNIQRGRDHALRSYNDYLKVMGHKKLRSFSDLPEEIGRKLAKLYHHPDDIDLWVGGLLESPVKDGIVGSTFSEIIADQFSRLKHGDRYFYEYGKNINPGAFTPEQLQEIRKASMARLICDNADHLTLVNVPPAAFEQSDLPLNKPVSCESSQIPIVNLAAWRGRIPD